MSGGIVITCSPDRRSTLLVPLLSALTSQNTDRGRKRSSMEAAVGMRVRVQRRLGGGGEVGVRGGSGGSGKGGRVVGVVVRWECGCASSDV